MDVSMARGKFPPDLPPPRPGLTGLVLSSDLDGAEALVSGVKVTLVAVDDDAAVMGSSMVG